MPNEVFQLTIVTRPLGENVELARRWAFPKCLRWMTQSENGAPPCKPRPKQFSQNTQNAQK